ncbi:nuclear transport factor 2 family protein [Novosphingobium sediminicola]|uniref:SnoaL-like domain-containing protein n=1 Tax=Novosphingobium sediminicola TaxID=563162 RepID=A0A7W6G7T2_9SPHN|nr:nuclear transport factor 2 family protein [Novosphingobium sediminicola]MBB3955287.1 hypothetical protein [Novosphingobium sediminicola]
MREIESEGRRIVLGAVAGLAGLAVVGPVSASEDSGPQNTPRQAWATKDNAVNIGPNAAPVADALDMLMIQQCFARYGMGHDEGLGPVLASLFTQDAVVEVADGHGAPFQVVRGREAVVANFANSFRQQGDQRRHCFTNIIVEEASANKARVLAYALVSVAAHGGLILGAAVIYTADLRKEGGIWRFSRLFIGMDAYTTPKPKV